MLGTLLASMVVLPCLSVATAWAANEPVIGIDVVIRSKADGRVIMEAITATRGAFVVEEMPPGH